MFFENEREVKCCYCKISVLTKERKYPPDYYCNKCKELNRSILNDNLPVSETKSAFLMKVTYAAEDSDYYNGPIFSDHGSYYAVYKDCNNDDIDIFGHVLLDSSNQQYLYQKYGYRITSMKILSKKNLIDLDKSAE